MIREAKIYTFSMYSREYDLREFLEYRPILIYEAWHVREDLTDEEIDEIKLPNFPTRFFRTRFSFLALIAQTKGNSRQNHQLQQGLSPRIEGLSPRIPTNIARASQRKDTPARWVRNLTPVRIKSDTRQIRKPCGVTFEAIEKSYPRRSFNKLLK